MSENWEKERQYVVVVTIPEYAEGYDDAIEKVCDDLQMAIDERHGVGGVITVRPLSEILAC